MPVEIPATFEIFDIPNLTTILPEPNIQNPQNKEKALKLYTESIMNLNTENTMIIFHKWFCPIKPRSSRCSCN